jgi:hypothetical protein
MARREEEILKLHQKCQITKKKKEILNDQKKCQMKTEMKKRK